MLTRYPLKALLLTAPLVDATLSQVTAGARDTAVPQDRTSRSDHAHVGLCAEIGPFTVDDFADAIRFIYNGGSTERRICEVDPRFVLAQAWQVNRLEDAQRRISQGVAEHPIQLSGIRFPGLPELYSVTDGMHRTVAARLAGRTTIHAVVDGYWLADPHTVCIRRHTLHYQRPEGFERRPITIHKGAIDILRSIGVADRIPPVLRLLGSGMDWLRRSRTSRTTSVDQQ